MRRSRTPGPTFEREESKHMSLGFIYLVLALLSAIPMQLLSYNCSLDREYDPDFPRNLSKTLTVD